MKKIFNITFFLFFTSIASPAFINTEDEVLIFKLNLFNGCTNHVLNVIALPLPIAQIETNLKKIDTVKLNKNCLNLFNEISKEINEISTNEYSEISYQSSSSGFFENRLGQRRYEKDHFSYTLQKNFDRVSFKIKLKNSANYNSALYDESYLSFLYNNKIITIGKQSQWWSPSSNTSLILSNNAIPTFGIRLENKIFLQPTNKFLSIFKDFKYIFFVNRLETNRDFPNAMLFGNRFAFSPFDNLRISLLRTTQFGGDGRNVNIASFTDMLLGKDTTNRNMSFEEQSGNQLAGIDFIYHFNNKNNTAIYGQLIGEDGLDPVFDSNSFIKFPSKTFKLIGFSLTPTMTKRSKVSFEFHDTYSGKPNVTYNHSLYSSGYRHYAKTIGASTDADSSKINLSLKHIQKNSNYINAQLSSNKINKHNSDQNFLSKKYLQYHQLDLGYKFKIKNNLYADIRFVLKNKQSEILGKNEFLLHLKYKFNN